MRALLWTAAVAFGLVSLASCYPQPAYSSSSSSSSSGGCHKGYRCGDSCIATSKSCHGGSTYKKRRK